MRLSTFVIFVGAALLTAAPCSLHWTPRDAGLYVDNADARVAYRRGYRPSYYDYGYNSAGCPRLFGYGYPAPYYGYPPYPCYWDRPYALWSGWR
jgi:hypothetical protein